MQGDDEDDFFNNNYKDMTDFNYQKQNDNDSPGYQDVDDDDDDDQLDDEEEDACIDDISHTE